jgi:protein-disulfide isomerase
MKYHFLSWLALFGLLGAPAMAQGKTGQPSIEDLGDEIQALKQTVKTMEQEIQEIKYLLQDRIPTTPPQNAILDLGNSPFQGKSDAALILVEFSDYQCPFCARYARETAPLIKKEYIETGKIKHVYVDFPLESIHPLAFKAAEAANCAGEQGKYWEMHSRLFANQQKLEPWTAHALAIGLDVSRFEACLNDAHQAEAVRLNLAEGKKAGVGGTPTFFLAYADPKSSSVRTITKLSGAQPFAAFKSAIDKMLAERPATNK